MSENQPDLSSSQREMREGVEPTAGALKLAQQNGANGELCERIAWALDPEAFQIWEREHERKPPDSGPTWDQMAVHGRRARARATAASLVSGPIASALAALERENATLRAERDEAIARAREPIGDTWDEIRRLEGECRVFIRERNEWKAVADTAEAENATLRASAERMEAALKPLAEEADFYDEPVDGEPLLPGGTPLVGLTLDHARAARVAIRALAAAPAETEKPETGEASDGC